MRVLFQMSASDSAALIDAPDAGTLGLNRALLYNDREGQSETFARMPAQATIGLTKYPSTSKRRPKAPALKSALSSSDALINANLPCSGPVRTRLASSADWKRELFDIQSGTSYSNAH